MSEQIRPIDTLAYCWDVKQPTNKQTNLPSLSLIRKESESKLVYESPKHSHLYASSYLVERKSRWTAKHNRHQATLQLSRARTAGKLDELSEQGHAGASQALIVLRKEKWGKEAADVSSSAVGNDVC